MKPIRITFYHYEIVGMIAQGINYNREDFFETVKDNNGEDIRIYDCPADTEYSSHKNLYKQVKRIPKKQCIKWIKSYLTAYGFSNNDDYNYTDEDYKLAQELIEKYNL